MKNSPSESNGKFVSDGVYAGTLKKDRELTFGERAVGLTFNPSQKPEVYKIKEHSAFLIDYFNDLRNASPSPDVKRYLSTAITQQEIACMVAVKAVTWN